MLIHTTIMAFGQDGDIQVGCGIMAMVMEMFGDMDLITFGQDHIHSTVVFMIHIILSGDITVPFIMGMGMDMVTHTDIIHGGDHMAIGIIITHMAEI